MISKNCKKYCREDISLIKNYDLAVADTKHRWVCHHINELTFTKQELIKQNMYYNRQANELIFLTISEHKKLHLTVCAGADERRRKLSESLKGRKLSDEHRRNISESHKGMKRKPFSEETKRKMGEARKGRKLSDETRKKISESHKRIWNNK